MGVWQLKIDFNQLFGRVTNLVFAIILLALTLAMIIGATRLFLNIWETLSTPGLADKYVELITDVLTLFVLVELSRSLADYFHEHRLRMTFIVDAAIVFFIRETMILFFQHKVDASYLYSISALLLALTALRIGSIFMFQREQKIVRTAEKLDSA